MLVSFEGVLRRRSPAAAALAIALVAAACTAAGGSSTPPPSDSGATPPPSSSAATTFYLRAWQTQALAPRETFTALPILTIADGRLIDGRVAVPAIYPGPLWAGPSVRSISADGIARIVAEARNDGLLASTSDFTGSSPLPGGVTAHVELVVDGVRYELTGDPTALERCRCIPEPGTSGAFAVFWQRLGGSAEWLASALGPESSYEPDRLAVLAIPPVEPAGGIAPNEVGWPLAAPFASFGTAYGGEADRCAVVSGGDLATLLPVVRQSNLLTRFRDATGQKRSLLVRVLVPGEPPACAA